MGREPDIKCILYLTAADAEALIDALTTLQFAQPGYWTRAVAQGPDGPEGVAFVRITDGDRCPVCHWPLESDPKKGCVPGNCSQRL